MSIQGQSKERKDTERTCQLITMRQLHHRVAMFWEIEECFSSKSVPSRIENAICEEFFQTTTTHDEA